MADSPWASVRGRALCRGWRKGWRLGGCKGGTGVTHTALPRPSDECGIVAQIAGPLAAADISAYYISTFNFDHALVSRLAGAGPWGKGRGPGEGGGALGEGRGGAGRP